MAKTDDLPNFRTGDVITEEDLNAIVTAIRVLRGLPVKIAVLALLVGLLSWQTAGTSLGMILLAEAFDLLDQVEADDLLSTVLVTLFAVAIAKLLAPKDRYH